MFVDAVPNLCKRNSFLPFEFVDDIIGNVADGVALLIFGHCREKRLLNFRAVRVLIGRLAAESFPSGHLEQFKARLVICEKNDAVNFYIGLYEKRERRNIIPAAS